MFCRRCHWPGWQKGNPRAVEEFQEFQDASIFGFPNLSGQREEYEIRFDVFQWSSILISKIANCLKHGVSESGWVPLEEHLDEIQDTSERLLHRLQRLMARAKINVSGGPLPTPTSAGPVSTGVLRAQLEQCLKKLRDVQSIIFKEVYSADDITNIIQANDMTQVYLDKVISNYKENLPSAGTWMSQAVLIDNPNGTNKQQYDQPNAILNYARYGHVGAGTAATFMRRPQLPTVPLIYQRTYNSVSPASQGLVRAPVENSLSTLPSSTPLIKKEYFDFIRAWLLELATAVYNTLISWGILPKPGAPRNDNQTQISVSSICQYPGTYNCTEVIYSDPSKRQQWTNYSNALSRNIESPCMDYCYNRSVCCPCPCHWSSK